MRMEMDELDGAKPMDECWGTNIHNYYFGVNRVAWFWLTDCQRTFVDHAGIRGNLRMVGLSCLWDGWAEARHPVLFGWRLRLEWPDFCRWNLKSLPCLLLESHILSQFLVTFVKSSCLLLTVPHVFLVAAAQVVASSTATPSRAQRVLWRWRWSEPRTVSPAEMQRFDRRKKKHVNHQFPINMLYWILRYIKASLHPGASIPRS